MRFSAAILALIAVPAIAPLAHAAAVPSLAGRPDTIITTAQERQYRSQRDCTPYNGPFGFYGNVWCQPPNEQSYMRNLGSRWPMETPPSLRYPKPANNSTDW